MGQIRPAELGQISIHIVLGPLLSPISQGPIFNFILGALKLKLKLSFSFFNHPRSLSLSRIPALVPNAFFIMAD
jgi:hypothetical protein